MGFFVVEIQDDSVEDKDIEEDSVEVKVVEDDKEDIVDENGGLGADVVGGAPQCIFFMWCECE